MKKRLFIMVVIGIILLVTAGCNNTDSLLTEVNLDNADKKVKSTLSNHYSKNGIYLYEYSTDEMYLFFNGYNVTQGEKAPYYTDIRIEVKDKTLVINFSEKYTNDYQNKEIENRLLYKIKKPKNIDTISILKNGQETHFDSIIVSE